jgi:cobalt-zinc-cadmium efflux system membrane fusion protein
VIRFRCGHAIDPKFVIATLALAYAASQAIDAHDGHAPLPTKGAIVQGAQLLLSERARNAIGVETAKITLADLRKIVQTQCQVQLPWRQQAHVSTLLPGRIVKVLARPGDRVEKDQELAHVESLEFETIQRDLLKAVSERTLAERLLTQREELAQANTIPAAMLTETRRKAEEAAAEAEIAIRKLMALGLSQATIDKVMASDEPVRSLSIRSSIRGEIASTEVRAGQVVARDEPLFHLVDLSVVEFAGKAIESDVPEISIGQSVKAVFLSVPDREFAGTVEHTALEVDDRSHTLTVIAHAENAGLLLKPGMSGRMSIEILSEKQTIVCPKAAIAGSPSAPFVFLERAAGRYDRRSVRLGASVGDRVEIRDGLFPGDKVVVVGTGVLTALFPPQTTAPKKPVPLAVSQAAIDLQIHGSREVGSQSARIEAIGEVEVPVQNRHFAATQVEGRISRIFVDPGDDVVVGQVLAEVASLPVFELQLELLRNQAHARWAREKATRLRSLQTSQAARKVDLWQAETDLDVVEHSIAEIRSQLKSLGFDDDALKSLEASGLDPLKRAESGTMSIPIRAPASGRLGHFEVTPGEVVRPSESGQAVPSLPLFEIHDRSKIWVCAHVRETQASLVRLGQVAQVSFPALPGKTVAGKVVRISPVFDPKSHVMPIWIEAANPDGRLFENMQAKVVIETESPRKPGSLGSN